jgi:hypothetical protein
MKRWVFAIIGGAVGTAAAVVYNYLFGPAPKTTFDQSYHSRLDWALAEGEKAADAREAELRAQLEAAKQPKPPAVESAVIIHQDTPPLPDTSLTNT